MKKGHTSKPLPKCESTQRIPVKREVKVFSAEQWDARARGRLVLDGVDLTDTDNPDSEIIAIEMDDAPVIGYVRVPKRTSAEA